MTRKDLFAYRKLLSEFEQARAPVEKCTLKTFPSNGIGHEGIERMLKSRSGNEIQASRPNPKKLDHLLLNH